MFIAPSLSPIAEQITVPLSNAIDESEVSVPSQVPVSSRKKLKRNIALVLIILLGVAMYFTWHSANATTAPPVVSQQSYSSAAPSSTVGSATIADTGTIVVYILGAITNPGVYKLPADARVYQLVQAAGGLLPDANAVALNMAAKLTDGEEIYVLAVGEAAPAGINTSGGPGGSPTATAGQLVNINTATKTEMMQVLHISATTADKIIAYRVQHGPYTSVTQLLQVVSKSIYDHIKNMVTV